MTPTFMLSVLLTVWCCHLSRIHVTKTWTGFALNFQNVPTLWLSSKWINITKAPEFFPRHSVLEFPWSVSQCESINEGCWGFQSSFYMYLFLKKRSACTADHDTLFHAVSYASVIVGDFALNPVKESCCTRKHWVLRKAGSVSSKNVVNHTNFISDNLHHIQFELNQSLFEKITICYVMWVNWNLKQ